jgi:hypothetical protein
MYYTLTMPTEQADSLPRAAGLITVQLGADLKRDWTQWCADRSLVPGKALRSLVERTLAEGLELATSPSGVTGRVVVANHPDFGSKVSRELQFTPSENAAIEAVAKAQGFAFQEWVIAAARAALAKAPAFGQAELEALTQSNAHMAQVAIELIAMRRQQSSDDDPAEALARLEGDIRRHVETVSVVMAQGAQRWQLKV